MTGSEAMMAPWDALQRYAAPLSRRVTLRHGRLLWTRRRGFLVSRLFRIRDLVEERDTVVSWPWVAAILWDELARRDVTERVTDWALGKLGRDPSVGAFQVTGGTAQSVVRHLATRTAWAYEARDATLAELRERLLGFDFATRIVVGRCEQILETWRQAGHDPLVQGGLGPHAVSAVALVGTLYSQGLGTPKAAPRANGRGLQIERFAAMVEVLSDRRELSDQRVLNHS